MRTTSTTQTSTGPSRRSVLALIGVGAAAPVAVTLIDVRPPPVVTDGVRFEVLDVTRRALARHDGAPVHTDGASWPDVVRVRLSVFNVAAAAVLLSPGQFRLRVADHLTVMPTAWEHGPSGLAAARHLTTWIDYRAPAASGPLRLEFTAAGRSEPVSVRLLALPGGRP